MDRRECWCGKCWGHYNQDGDTATISKDAKLLGLLNSFFYYYGIERIKAQKRDPVFWYPLDNGKITIED